MFHNRFNHLYVQEHWFEQELLTYWRDFFSFEWFDRLIHLDMFCVHVTNLRSLLGISLQRFGDFRVEHVA
jgi:hypothetical protein